MRASILRCIDLLDLALVIYVIFGVAGNLDIHSLWYEVVLVLIHSLRKACDQDEMTAHCVSSYQSLTFQISNYLDVGHYKNTYYNLPFDQSSGHQFGMYMPLSPAFHQIYNIEKGNLRRGLCQKGPHGRRD